MLWNRSPQAQWSEFNRLNKDLWVLRFNKHAAQVFIGWTSRPIIIPWMSPKSTRKLCNTVLSYRGRKRTCSKSTRIALLVKRTNEVRGRDSDSRTTSTGREEWLGACSRFFAGQSYLRGRNQNVGGRMHGSGQMKVSRFPRTVWQSRRHSGWQKDETEMEGMVVDSGGWTRFV